MKVFKHFVLAAALATCVGASAQDGVQTISPYSVDFETSVTTSGNFAVSKGWGRIGTSTSLYSYRTSQGVDGSKALYCGYQSASAPNYLVTTRLTGSASLMVKNYNASTQIKFYKVTKDDAGAYVVGEEITASVDGTPSTSAYVTYSIDGLQNEMVAIYAHYAYIDNFAATSAEVDLFKSLKVLSCKATSSSTPDCDADGNFVVTLTGKIKNDGDLAFAPGDANFTYSIGKYVSSSEPYIILATKPIEQALAVGDTADVEITATLNVADHPTRSRYDLVENYKNTFAYGAWVEPIKYEPKLLLRDNNNSNMGTDEKTAKKFGTFGMISADVTKNFVVENTGAAPMTVNITVPEGFAVSQATADVAAHDKVTLTLTALAATPGIYSGDLSVAVVGFNTITVPLSSTVLDVNKYFENFEANNTVNTPPAGWYECNTNTYWTKTTYTNGSNNFMKNSNSSTPSFLATPKLVVAEGEKMTFDAARPSTSGTCFINVYYSTDRKNWTLVMPKESIDLTGTNAGTSSVATQTWSTFVLEGVPAGEYYIAFEAGYACIDNVYGFQLATVAHDVVERGAKISAAATVNNEYTATYKVRNLNTVEEEDGAYTVKFYFNNEEVAEAESVSIAPGADAEFELAFTPYEAGTFPAYVKLAWEDGYEVVSDTVQVTVGEEMATATVQVGNPTTATNSPLYLNYKNSVSETLYTAEMLAAAGIKAGDKIGSIVYKGYNTAAELTSTVKAFVKQTNDTEFGEAAMTPDADMVKVFEGEYTFKKEGTSADPVDMLVINFSEPIVYNGGALRVKLQSEASVYKNIYFQVDGDVANMCYGQRNDNTKVADFTSYTAWKFPVTNFGIVLTPAQLTGKVVDQAGNALEGVKVQLVEEICLAPAFGSAKIAQARYQGVTDANGEYAIPVIQSGKIYDVTYSKEGYVPVTIVVDAIGAVDQITLEKEVPTAVTDVTASKALNSNVYTIDGRIVKQNATSLEGLDKGIYIFQGKKYIVK
ncbi:MAG: carboxypeptidase regulatory-like domain-containing protein [Bacteroidales bacterium]|nr:carboxypeptidase regulatory-like domain-containing protein [Bacteroidales bacterium]